MICFQLSNLYHLMMNILFFKIGVVFQYLNAQCLSEWKMSAMFFDKFKI
jgi:hypothetical protein